MTNEILLNSLDGAEIAVIGMDGRFPGASNIEQYWQNLRDGVESLVTYTDEELRAAGVPESLLRHPHYVKSGAPLDKMEWFDAAFFGFGPRDAAIMDPQHRHFLEVAWGALEQAGYDPARFDGRVGVFGGSGHNAYMPYNLLTNPELVQSIGLFLLRHTGNDKDFLTTRVSYLFDLKGPSVNVQTACSTSLVAIHLAGQSLLNGECDMALAGGVTIELPHRQGYLYHEGEIVSPDGHCRSFDHRSEGARFGSGVGVVALRRLEDAIRDGDMIRAVIRGSAVNNDGAGKVNYLAPSVDGQAAAIAEAIAIANVPPESISYVETHGTGTRIGDPIEVTALTQAFRAAGADQNGFCAIGSAKTNIGHLDTAAGVAGFIKVVESLKHRQIPASLNFEKPNPMIDFENSPFFVNAERREWPQGAAPRRAGISSLGVGGTNAHIVLEEAPELEPSSGSRPSQLLLFSAKTAAALDSVTANFADFLRRNPAVNLADAAYTLQVGRAQMPHRRAVAVCDVEDAIHVLTEKPKRRLFTANPGDAAPDVVFMFPGGGAQYPNMGRDLVESEPLARQIVDECLALLRGQLDEDLRPLMFPEPGQEEAAARLLQRPSLNLPAIFIIEYALARLWQSWGVQPAAMTGHSMGEYTAACLAGVLSLADALKIVAWRGQLFETLPDGAMLSVSAAEDVVRSLLAGGLDIAVINAPELCVVSGKAEEIERMTAVLDEQAIEYRRIKINVAAHSAMLDPILEEFRRRLQTIRFHPPQIPYIANVTGDWARPDEVTTPDYWVRHLRHTVRFADGLGRLMDGQPHRIFLEVGPGTTLSSLAWMHPARQRSQTILASLRHPKEQASQRDAPDLQFALTTLGRLWLAGATVDWAGFYERETRHRIPLPTYPFERQRYWIEPGTTLFSGAEAGPPPLAKLPNMDDWFYAPVWEQANLPANAETGSHSWLIFADELGVGAAVRSTINSQQLTVNGQRAVIVTPGERFRRMGDYAYEINPRARVDYGALMAALAGRGLLPSRVLHLWLLNHRLPGETGLRAFYRNQDLGFYSLLFLAQALGEMDLPAPLHVTAVANGVYAVHDEPVRYPEKATLLGPCLVIPREYPDITCALVDVAVDDVAGLAEKLAAETAVAENGVFAWREDGRYRREFSRRQFSRPETFPICPGATVLVTGGTGGIGSALADHLAAAGVNVVAVSRSRYSVDSGQYSVADPSLNTDYRTVPTVLRADVTSREQMAAAIAAARARFGRIDGVIHAAGTLRDGPIQLKSPLDAEAVLGPKVRGAFLLAELLADDPPDFMVLFGSTSAAIGPAGQVDYVAANEFLNAFSCSEFEGLASRTRLITLNWGVWQRVGMAAAAAVRLGLAANEDLPGDPVDHPLLEKLALADGREQIFTPRYGVDSHWLLAEHRLRGGAALVPGTGYLEMARAAFHCSVGSDRYSVGSNHCSVEIRDLFFVSPLAASEGRRRDVQVKLAADWDGFAFTVSSRSSAGWVEHARATMGEVTAARPEPLDLAAIAARCDRGETRFAPGEQATQQERFLDFGPRWKNLRQVCLGDGEALARLELLPDYADDLATFTLHPALMDLATSFGLPLLPGYADGEDFYVPWSYRRVRVFAPLAIRVASYVRLHPKSTPELPQFDVMVTDGAGQVLVEIEGFTLKRVAAAEMRVDGTATAVIQTTESSLLKLGLTDGILPEEGARALARVLAGETPPQLFVTSLDLDALIGQANRANEAADGGFKLARPELQSVFAAPRNGVEERLAQVWQELLGIDQVGIDDDFFELGGHSLIAARLFTRIKKLFGV